MDQEQQTSFKHFCRICNKGFMCGMALGGHMRAHRVEDDDPGSELEEVEGDNKRMYQLRDRMKSCRSCENCGKEFLSWKSFLKHRKCNSDEASGSRISSPEAEFDGEDDGGNRNGGGGGWSKRKRSIRSNVGSIGSSYVPSEDDDIFLARCLVQLANATPVEMEESSASASRDWERRNPSFNIPMVKKVSNMNSNGFFECKDCNKVFNSHQALGGHRASHRKVKGCLATKMDQVEEEFLRSKPTSLYQIEAGRESKKIKIHECSICHRVFPTGQALGGHKRCHWITLNAQETSSTPPKFHFSKKSNNLQPCPKLELGISDRIDLNEPAWTIVSNIRNDPNNPLSFEVPTEMDLGIRGDSKIVSLSQQYPENKSKDCNLELGKLSDLEEETNNGGSSQWLQVGIGSINQQAPDIL